MLKTARNQQGFTLIEVTLSIVIGIILIAGATLLYNQAKTGAGNTRAKAKVLALQGAIEESAANAGGTYPAISALQSLWQNKRPDDYNNSPWGGSLAAAGGSNGVTSENTGMTPATPLAGAMTGPFTGGVPATPNSSAGVLVYDTTLGSANGQSWFWDAAAGSTVSAPTKNYVVYIVQPPNGSAAQCVGPSFTTGGK